MKKLAIFLSLVLVASSLVSQWEWQNPKLQGNDLNDVQFFNNQEGWAVGDYGNIMHTSDGGSSWEFQNSGTLENLNKLFLHDENTASIVGSLGCILFTENGGNNWSLQMSGTNFNLIDLSFIDSNHGWTLGITDDGWSTPSMIMYTNNGGLTWDSLWSTVYSDSTYFLQSIHFLNDTVGWGVGTISIDSMPSQPLIMRTSDGGVTWEIQPDWIFPYLGCGFRDVYFTDHDNGWVVGGCQSGHNIVHTTDGGETWVSQYDDFHLTSVYFTDNDIGWAVGWHWWSGCGSGPVLVNTINGGDTWQLDDEFNAYEFCMCTFNGINFSDADNGWVVGKFGRIHHTTNGGLTWESQCEEATHIPFNDVCFTDSLYGWAVGWSYYPDGSSPVVMHTQDGGNVWEDLLGNIKTNYVDFSFKAVSFADHLNGWIVGEDLQDGGAITYTNDGGTTWEQQYIEPGNEYSGVCFVDQNNGWVSGALGRILHTIDGGVEWEIQNSGTTESLRDVFFIDQNNGWAAGNNGTILHTNNGGVSWIQQESGTNENLFGIHFYDSDNGGVVGKNGIILLTTNGGISWETQYSGQISDLDGIFMTAADIVWVVGSDYIDPNYYSVILNTSDGGSSWVTQIKPSAPNKSLKSIWFTDQSKGWVVGGSGTILHTDNGGIVGMIERLYAFDNIFNLEAFPNPFNNKITIKYELDTKLELHISILNQLGQETETLFEGIKEKSTHQLTWDSKNLSSGIYFIKLQSDQGIATQKIIKK